MTSETWRPTLGAVPDAQGVRFRVWAPAAERVEVLVSEGDASRAHSLARERDGHFAAHVVGVRAGARYRYRLDGGHAYPDPASRAQPDGVHGASEVVDPGAFHWTDHGWRGIAPDALVIYELHVGTFTPEGTFDAAIARLDAIADLGVTAVEVMPVAAFSGTRGWGYDGVALFAPAAPYGGPEAFRRFVDAAHARGLAVILDVVYNHLGPEGNYLHAVTGGRYFTHRHRTPWGDAVNFDGPESAPVRAFVLENALHWAHEYHVDGFRLDATHAISDDTPVHVLRELADRLHALERPRVLIAEDDRNERRLVLPAAEGGYGLDAVWADDLHHQLRRHTAGDAEAYFAAFTGSLRDVATTLREGWFHDGSAERHRAASGAGEAPAQVARGTPADALTPRAFVHHLQNHDQVGNRAFGDRLHHVVTLSTWRALSALLLLSPYTPMLWMGQEWAASTPFLYFTDHPAELGRLVTAGRREEFRRFSAFSDPLTRERIPDPQAPDTFHRSKLRWEERRAAPHAGVLALYRELLALRRSEPALRPRERAHFAVRALDDRALALRRRSADGAEALLLVASFTGRAVVALDAHADVRPPAGRRWAAELSTEEARFGGDEGERDHAAAHAVETVTLRGPSAVLLRAVG